MSPEPVNTINRWAGVPGIVHQTSNGTEFYYKTNHNTSAGEEMKSLFKIKVKGQRQQLFIKIKMDKLISIIYFYQI